MSGSEGLVVEGLAVRYGRVEVVHGVDFRALPGQVTCLVGNNGAGKTTTIRGVLGLQSSRARRVTFDGHNLSGMPPHAVARRGIALVPEGRRVFADLTVLENLRMGAVRRSGGWRDTTTLGEVYELFPELSERGESRAGLLSGGQQQMLAMGRAMMARPEMLVLDEPSMGLSPVLVNRIYEALVALRDQGFTILLSEQNANLALELADHAYILETGRVVEDGVAADLADSARVRAIYLGA
ncbi:ABC transporter ATP-binding protein [Nocardioides carbamazepini]|uniref:ABC transporter ATP-binding protein n=1 Tax=Nocardioides carbamazepini TaxID=2854259 RepID=UPI00214A6491|nr:ABC transporter ATP-binding protein [Nocardioides carbamazepini]MCR1784788.1 ABC transporter ATP-binding protein [Nocardioides carbamazepini]